MLKLGIDEAGKGPVIGPLIIAGCLIKEEDEKTLKKLGVDDSKKITQKKREFLEEKIKEIAEAYEIIIITPNEIDDSNANRTKLNEVEAKACAKIINRINKGYKNIRVILDCPSVNISKWEDFLKTKIKNLSNLEIVCEHKADENHISVSAASILAKCVREKEIEKIKKVYGDKIGSGYTSDPLTIKFLEKNARKYEDRGIFRKTWITWRQSYNNLTQKKLS